MSVHMVWIESMIDQAAASCPARALRRCPRRGLGGELDRRVREAKTFGAQPDLGDRLFAGNVDDAVARVGERRGAWIRSVDLPMPGSPPTSSAEPGTNPPPVTRSSSAIPEDRRGASLAVARELFECEYTSFSAGCARGHRGDCWNAALLADRVPFAARLALALPTAVDGAAVLADERGALRAIGWTVGL